MTDEQIINGFRHLLKKYMNKLSVVEKLVCGDIIDLINRQKAKIEELHSDKIIAETHERAAKDLFVDCTRQLEETKAEIERLLQKLQQAKSEAIKVFAERLKEIIYAHENRVDVDGIVLLTRIDNSIDTLVKEMTEEQENVDTV